MTKNKSCCRMLVYDEDVFGNRKPSEETLQYWRDKGWLGENGICNFPRATNAYPSGVITPYSIDWWENANEDELLRAIDAGYIKFLDGSANEYTREEYKKKYPEYVDPYYLLKMEGRLPPDVDKYINLGDKKVVKEWVKLIFRPMI